MIMDNSMTKVEHPKFSADYWSDIAYDAFFRGDRNGAQWYYRKALQADPQHPESLCNIGVILIEKDDNYSEATITTAKRYRGCVHLSDQTQSWQLRIFIWPWR